MDEMEILIQENDYITPEIAKKMELQGTDFTSMFEKMDLKR
ncbi:MAG: hypothetical protein SO042_04925 [Bulleidia sp.]|nr:hypothetical protein [Bulleidia sp.]